MLLMFSPDSLVLAKPFSKSSVIVLAGFNASLDSASISDEIFRS